MNRIDSGASLADRKDLGFTRNESRRTARLYMKILFVGGAAAIVSGVIDGGISMWIVGAACMGVATYIGITNW